MAKKYVSKGDLARRWGVSNQVVQNWDKREKDFPAPVFRVGNGRIPIYELSTIEAYEKTKGIAPKGETEDGKQ